jgi:hypothetical protein
MPSGRTAADVGWLDAGSTSIVITVFDSSGSALGVVVAMKSSMISTTAAGGLDVREVPDTGEHL